MGGWVGEGGVGGRQGGGASLHAGVTWEGCVGARRGIAQARNTRGSIPRKAAAPHSRPPARTASAAADRGANEGLAGSVADAVSVISSSPFIVKRGRRGGQKEGLFRGRPGRNEKCEGDRLASENGLQVLLRAGC